MKTLHLPQSTTINGSVSAIKVFNSLSDERFKKDKVIIAIQDASGSVQELWMNKKHYDVREMQNILIKDNMVSIVVNINIADETGFYEDDDIHTLTAHTRDWLEVISVYDMSLHEMAKTAPKWLCDDIINKRIEWAAAKEQTTNYVESANVSIDDLRTKYELCPDGFIKDRLKERILVICPDFDFSK